MYASWCCIFLVLAGGTEKAVVKKVSVYSVNKQLLAITLGNVINFIMVFSD